MKPVVVARLARRALATAVLALAAMPILATITMAYGPPFPDPVPEQAVYDEAGVLSAATIASAEATIDAIEARTGAELVVYTQVTWVGEDRETADAHAAALIDQWGIGRRGFDDGLVILIDFEPNLVHGQVTLFAGAGFRGAFLTDSERQGIFDDDMLPHLKAGDFDGAVLVALQRVGEAATPEHAAELDRARQIDAVLGLLIAPLLGLGLIGWAALSWLRVGRDPVYLDDPSILMPAPPAGLTPAAGALVREGTATRRALTAALLDLASRGGAAFRQETSGVLGMGKGTVGIVTKVDPADDVTEGYRALARRRPESPAETALAHELELVGRDGYIEPENLSKLGTFSSRFDELLEKHVVAQGWFAAAPSTVRAEWYVRGLLIGFPGGIVAIIGANIPFAGLLMLGSAAFVGGIVVGVIGYFMPAVTVAGAMIRAMLAAYRRTLQKTMAEARSMAEVIEGAGISWLEAPDQAIAWGTALGLQDEIEGVLRRSLEDVETGVADPAILPVWFHASDGRSIGSVAADGGGGGGGIFSSSPIPNIGGMMAAIGTIGTPPSSSGSGGGGGGFGGGGSGGGGGAGGGF